MTCFRRRLVPFLVLALLVAASTLRAQATATTGQIEGTVSDATGAALPGASVTARNPVTGFEREPDRHRVAPHQRAPLPGLHNFVANATWNLASDIQIGVIFSARSGLPYSHLANQDLNFDGDFGNDRQFVGGIDTTPTGSEAISTSTSASRRRSALAGARPSTCPSMSSIC